MIQDIAPHQYDVTYKNAKAEPDNIMLIYDKGSLLCHMEGNQISYPTVREIAEVFPMIYEKAKFLFHIDEEDYFELHQPKIEPFGKWKYLPKEGLRNARPIWMAYAGITGFQIHKWYTEHRFCGKCGKKMKAKQTERAMQCLDCGRVVYPQICPSVIVGITDDSRILMTKYASSHSNYKKYALVAGYAEIGESLENTVAREGMEEVGLKVKNIRYYKSQPWGFDSNLLLGYYCEVDGGTSITIDETELATARFVKRDKIEEDKNLLSLTATMIDRFRKGLE